MFLPIKDLCYNSLNHLYLCTCSLLRMSCI